MPKKEDWYWPLGSFGYADEIQLSFPEEAQLLGVITILWNNQEAALKRLFVEIVSSPHKNLIEALWDRQPTHQSRRDMLALCLSMANLNDRQTNILSYVLEKTKTVADRRNELIHAEYVVNGETDHLHARIKSPRSIKPPKYQKATSRDLEIFVKEMDFLVRVTEGAWFEMLGKDHPLKLRFSTINQPDLNQTKTL